MSAVPVPSEHAEQVTFVQWFRRQYPSAWIFAVPNGGDRNPIVAGKLKAEGVSRGVPDLYIPAWRLWIEMKRQKGGRLSAEQREWIAYLGSIGDTVIVGHGAQDAIDQVQKHAGKATQR